MELSETSASLMKTDTVYLPQSANGPIPSKYTFTASGSLVDCLSTPSFGLLICNVTCVVSTLEPSPPTLLHAAKKMSSAAAPRPFKRALGNLSRRAGMLEAMHIADPDFFLFDQS